jgi:transposase
LEWHILRTAKAHDSRALHILRSIPGIGKILSLVMLYEGQDIRRFSRPQQFASYARLIRPVKESGGTRTGSSHGKIGNAYVKWAFSEAVVLFLRETREAQPYIRKLKRKYGKNKTKGILAHRLGRTVYYMLTHTQLFDINKFVNQEQGSKGAK